jgi:hypothetical protein
MVLGITGDATVNNGSSERLRTPFMMTEWRNEMVPKRVILERKTVDDRYIDDEMEE